MSKTLAAVLKKVMSISSDIRSLSISTAEGVELVTECRSQNKIDEGTLVSSLIPIFVNSCKQSQRLGLGNMDNSIIWISTGIVIQKNIGGMIMTMILDDTANIGLVEENLPKIVSILHPFCSTFVTENLMT